jgi:hypothetical protein
MQASAAGYALTYATALKLQLVREHAVAYLIEALCYKPEGCGFNSR